MFIRCEYVLNRLVKILILDLRLLIGGIIPVDEFMRRWFESVDLIKKLYSSNIIYEIGPNNLPPVQDLNKAIVDAVKNPIGCEPLDRLVRPGMKVVVVADDITRATPRDKILPVLLNELNRCGVPDNDITIVIALGTHRYMSDDEILKCFGEEVVRRVRIVNHEWLDSSKLVYVGTTRNGTPVYVNKLVYEADFVVGVGSIIPHLYAGYGGGAKIIQPGVCGEKTTAYTHILAAMEDPMKLLGDPDNVVRKEMEEVADVVGLDFIVNVVFNGRGEVVKVVAGDMRKAFREGVKVAETIYRREIPELADIVVVNTYPALIDYWQAIKGFVHSQLGVREGGTVILYTDCPDRISPIHGKTFEKYRHANIEELNKVIKEGVEEDLVGLATVYVHTKYIHRVECICVSEGLTPEDKEVLRFKHANTLLDALDMALAKHGRNAKIGIIHHGGEVYPALRKL
ncbi:MAG: nickel-dependent lactate racemase [Sulfolobales archaeon]